LNLANLLTLSGTAEANSTVQLYDGTTLLGAASVNDSGVWSFVTSALANGAHSFTATDSTRSTPTIYAGFRARNLTSRAADIMSVLNVIHPTAARSAYLWDGLATLSAFLMMNKMGWAFFGFISAGILFFSDTQGANELKASLTKAQHDWSRALGDWTSIRSALGAEPPRS
jgi:hypothetical protein